MYAIDAVRIDFVRLKDRVMMIAAAVENCITKSD
jgi:hypothetical protein